MISVHRLSVKQHLLRFSKTFTLFIKLFQSKQTFCYPRCSAFKILFHHRRSDAFRLTQPLKVVWGKENVLTSRMIYFLIPLCRREYKCTVFFIQIVTDFYVILLENATRRLYPLSIYNYQVNGTNIVIQ